MKRVYVEDFEKHAGEEVEVRGWLYNMRSSGKILFLQVRDGSGYVQCVVSKYDLDEEAFEQAKALTQETSLIIRGKLRADKRAPGGYEINVTELEKIGDSIDYPITKKEHGDAFLLDHRHLWLRSAKQHALLRIRHELISAFRDFYNNRGFINFDSPIFTPNAVEGTTTLFSTEYFDTTAYLAQSGQLYGEAGAMAHGKIYTFGPTFRAEKSKTRRHLTEFWMLEPEVAFINFEELQELSEDMIMYGIERVLERRRPELETLERDISKLEAVKKPFPRIDYHKCADILEQYAKDHPGEEGSDFVRGDDFGAKHETIVAEPYDSPVIITRFPASFKAFYMKRDPEDNDLVLGMDMIAPEGYGEIIGGSIREDDYETILKRVREHDLPEEMFQWYLDLRKYGSVPHGGFGLGFERTVTWIAGRKHLREAIPFPRMMYRLNP